MATAWLTRIAGASFIRYFEQDQDWGDDGVQQVVEEVFELNRRDASLQRFLATAMRRVVEPMQRRAGALPPRPEPPVEADASGHGHPEP